MRYSSGKMCSDGDLFWFAAGMQAQRTRRAKPCQFKRKEEGTSEPINCSDVGTFGLLKASLPSFLTAAHRLSRAMFWYCVAAASLRIASWMVSGLRDRVTALSVRVRAFGRISSTQLNASFMVLISLRRVQCIG